MKHDWKLLRAESLREPLCISLERYHDPCPYVQLLSYSCLRDRTTDSNLQILPGSIEVQDFGYETDLIRVSLAEHCSAHGFQHISEETRRLPQRKFKRGLSCENATTPASHSQPAPQLPTACLAAHSSQMPGQALMASQHRSCLQPSWLHSSQVPE